MAELDNAFVKRGLWTNWSQGPIMGQTITTDIQTGTIIVSVLAILSSLATSHLWHIVTFIAHQIRARGSASDGLFWQQQALLRTLPAPSTIVAGNVNLWWAWRRTATRAFLRCVLQILLPLMFISGTLVATVFTSFVVDTTNLEVLVNSPLCGSFNNSDPSVETYAYKATLMVEAERYASECYQNDTSLPVLCHTIYTSPRLPLTVTRSDCPFDVSMCQPGTQPAVSLDTGMINLKSAIGINTRKQDEVTFRKKNTCSVVPLNGHFEIIPPSNDTSGRGIQRPLDALFRTQNPYLALFLGPVGGMDSSKAPNATLQIPLPSKMGLATYSANAYAGDLSTKSEWAPLPELSRKDADLSILILQLNGSYYESPVDDPLFSAHRAYGNSVDAEQSVYLSDYPAGVFACAEQYQFCIPQPSGKDICTGLEGLPKMITKESFPEASPIQLAQLQLARLHAEMFPMSTSVAGDLNATAGGFPVSSLPPDQWLIEALNWNVRTLSSMQIMMAEHATGPAAKNPALKELVISPMTEGEQQLCHAQKMKKAGGFANVSFFGLVFIIIVSISIIVLDLSLVYILEWLQTTGRSRWPRLERWTQDGILQLQRRAFEAEGKGSWTRLDQEVPITTYNTHLAELSNKSNSSVQRIELSFPYEKGSRAETGISSQDTLQFGALSPQDTFVVSDDDAKRTDSLNEIIRAKTPRALRRNER